MCAPNGDRGGKVGDTRAGEKKKRNKRKKGKKKIRKLLVNGVAFFFFFSLARQCSRPTAVAAAL